MRDSWNAARVGLMVVLGFAAFFAVYRYVDERSAAGEGYGVHAYFADVQGLIAKSRVLVAGIPVGYIESIRLEGAQARVDIRMEEGVKLYEDASISMKSISFLGERVLVIEPGTAGKPQLADGSEIRLAISGVQTDDVLKTVSEIAESVRKVTTQFERAFGNDQAGVRMESALQNLAEALESINRMAQQNEEAIGETIQNLAETTEQAGPRLVKILENVEQATAHLSGIIDARRDDIDRAVSEADDTIVSIRRAADELEAVLKDVHQISERTARGEGTVGRLTHDDALIDEIEGVAEGLNDVVGGIARLRTIVELRSEYNYLANSFKTYFSLRLQPREGRYFLLQVIDDPRGKDTFRQTFVQRSPPPDGEPAEYRETSITRTEALRFSVMLAKRISFATFRFGILESTGGLGMDLHLFRDRLELNTDIFAIGVQKFPRFRARLSAEILKRFWILAGVDDIANGRNRDVFMGLMLRFDDDDLKSLLPFAGAARP